MRGEAPGNRLLYAHWLKIAVGQIFDRLAASADRADRAVMRLDVVFKEQRLVHHYRCFGLFSNLSRAGGDPELGAGSKA